MKLYHTSPGKIESINRHGRFGSFLFFSADVYTTTAGVACVYSIEVDEGDLIEASRLFYQDGADTLLDPVVRQLMALAGVDADTAEGLLEESLSAHELDVEDPAELSWDIQRLTAECARRLGYRGVIVEDEQGSAYMIDMLGREADLSLEKKA